VLGGGSRKHFLPWMLRLRLACFLLAFDAVIVVAFFIDVQSVIFPIVAVCLRILLLGFFAAPQMDAGHKGFVCRLTFAKMLLHSCA
jgi:hypothetical protein